MHTYPYGVPTNVPNTSPIPLQACPAGPQLGSLGFGMDPNPAFTAAINRLAAALEKLAEA
jgi:hypothetical protein